MKKRPASKPMPRTLGPESLGQTYWQKAGYPTVDEYRIAMGGRPIGENIENINAPRPGMYRNPSNNTWQNMPPRNNSMLGLPPNNNIQPVTMPGDISSKIENDGPREGANYNSRVSQFPSQWGTPPRIQTADVVDLPLGGKGSSTLANWQRANIKKYGMPTTSQSGTDFTGSANPPTTPQTPSSSDPANNSQPKANEPSTDLTPGRWRLFVGKAGEGNSWEWTGQGEPTTPPPNTGGNRPPMRPPAGGYQQGGADWHNQWLNGTVGSPNRPPHMRPSLDYASTRIATPVDGINFDNKKELNKQLAKLDQDLRNAKAQNDGGSIERLEAKQQAANDVIKAMRAGFNADEAKQFALREAEIRKAQQRPASVTPPRTNSQVAGLPSTPSTQLNKLANDATAGGKVGEKAKAALEERAAAGDPQAANALKTLNVGMVSPQEADRILREDPNKYDRMKRAGQIPGNQQIYDQAVRDAQKMAGSRVSSVERNPRTTKNPSNNPSIQSEGAPSKKPSAEEMAAEMDKQNRAKEMASQAAQQRAAARKAAEIQGTRDTVARKMGFQNAAEAEKAGAKIGYPGQGIPGAGGGGGRRGGGGGGRGGSAPRQTAKERNMAAEQAANQAARRADRGSLSDGAYARLERDSASWGDTPEQRENRFKKAGANPNYAGHLEDPRTAKDVAKADAAAQKNQWGKWKDVPKLASDPKGKVPAAEPIPDIGMPSMPQIQPTASTSGGARGFFTRADGTVVPIV